jgi:hypothetical protein
VRYQTGDLRPIAGALDARHAAWIRKIGNSMCASRRRRLTAAPERSR